jgi:hypothetical protein
MDGFSIAQGDCNDCDANVNPNAVEVIGDEGSGEYIPADEDCDLQADEPQDICDQGLAVADTNPMNAAKAVELCKQSAGSNDWGVVSAKCWPTATRPPRRR